MNECKSGKIKHRIKEITLFADMFVQSNQWRKHRFESGGATQLEEAN